MIKNKIQEDLCKKSGITEEDIKKRIEYNKPIFEKGNCVIKNYWRIIACQELLKESSSLKHNKEKGK